MAGEFQAVSIRAGSRACAVAKEAKEQRFLALEAPALPMPDCAAPSRCRCRYRHHADRREGPRRDRDVGLPGIFWTLTERRDPSRGRRATDRNAA